MVGRYICDSYSTCLPVLFLHKLPVLMAGTQSMILASLEIPHADRALPVTNVHLVSLLCRLNSTTLLCEH